MRAELRSAAIGLEEAWNLGARKVLLELDSLTAVQAIEEGSGWDTRHGPILRQTLQLRTRDRQVVVRYCYREANRVADLLAHLGHCNPLGVHLLTSLPPHVRSAVFSDCGRIRSPHLCPSQVPSISAKNLLRHPRDPLPDLHTPRLAELFPRPTPSEKSSSEYSSVADLELDLSQGTIWSRGRVGARDCS
ncbi:hypothetical protein LINPERHAP1_LOCUS15698 [Linum perenne]